MSLQQQTHIYFWGWQWHQAMWIDKPSKFQIQSSEGWNKIVNLNLNQSESPMNPNEFEIKWIWIVVILIILRESDVNFWKAEFILWSLKFECDNESVSKFLETTWMSHEIAKTLTFAAKCQWWWSCWYLQSAQQRSQKCPVKCALQGSHFILHIQDSRLKTSHPSFLMRRLK